MIQYSEYTDVVISDLCWPLVYHTGYNVIAADVRFVYINPQPQYELSRLTRSGQFQKFGKI